MKARRLILIIPVIMLCLLCLVCTKEETAQISHIQHNDWAPDVKAGINAFFDDCHGTGNAYVVFDFDNTSSIFDIEEQLAIHQLETMSFAMSPERLVQALATGLDGYTTEHVNWIADINAAYSYLYTTYGPFSAKGLSSSGQQKIQADPQWMEFATKMRALYGKVKDWTSTDNVYNWILYWFTGMTENEVYDLAYASHKKYASVSTSVETWTSPDTISSKVGQVSVSWTRGIQVSENIKELWKCLKENGINVWLCSASGIDQVKAAVDAFGLYSYCTGVLAMTAKKDNAGFYTNSYDYDSGYAALTSSNGWTRGNLSTKCQTSGTGKVTAILNAIAPLYNNASPLAGFMDSTSDFNFCTEFSSLRVVVCFNRADRKITDGGGLIAEIAIYEKETLGYDYKAAIAAGNTLYLLQGRDENGLRSLRPSNSTVLYGTTEEKLFANQDNYDQLNTMINEKLTVGEAINRFSKNFLSTYNGYHSRM